MSKINYLALVGALSLMTGCSWLTSPITPTIDTTTSSVDTSAQTYWLDYVLTQCNSAPWGDSIEPQIVIDYFSGAVNIITVEVTPPVAGIVFCQACGCPTGTVISIQTDAAGEAYLLEQGFVVSGEALEQSADILTTPTPDTTVLAETIEPSVIEEGITNAEVAELAALSEADAALRERAHQVETALADYYMQHGSYPEDLAVLQLELDLTSITYTPIGAPPTTYYDLAVAYTTGAEIWNP